MIKRLKKLFKTKVPSEFESILSEVRKIYEFAPVDFGGGCSFQKALTLGVLIKELGFQTSADIGVYRGRSLFPQAIAHKKFTKGITYGIDPYDNTEAVQNDKPELKEVLDNFARNTNFDQIFNDVTNVIRTQNLEKFCYIIRLKSKEAKSFFIENKLKLGLVHIDGNHDTSFVVNDVHDYLPLVQDGGIVVLDDISWDSVKPALNILNMECKLIGDLIDSNYNDFAVFMKNGTHEQFTKARNILNSVINYKFSS